MVELLLHGFLKSFLLVIAALVPILNPAASAPVFLSLTAGVEARTRRHLSRLIARNVVILMLASMLVGSYVLEFFGLSLSIVRIGGGAILIANAWRMLNAPAAQTQPTASLASTPAPLLRQFAFYPLTFPVTCGPASISIAITLGVTLNTPKLAVMLANTAGGASALVAIGFTTLYAFRYADRLLDVLGDTGAAVFLRLSAFILLCLGIEILWQGASELLLGLATTV